jgi:hypothetical protein
MLKKPEIFGLRHSVLDPGMTLPGTFYDAKSQFIPMIFHASI